MRASTLSQEAAAAAGRAMDIAPRYKTILRDAGFVDVVETKLKWPLNEWPKDPYFKELGAWTYENLNSGLEGLLLALFTRFLGWTREDVYMFCVDVRNQLRDRRVHAYIPM